MENFHGFVVSNVIVKTETSKIMESIAHQLNSQLMIFDFSITEDIRTLVLSFDKPQKKEYLEALFPNSNTTPIPEFEKRVTRFETIYLTNIPTEFEDSSKLQSMVQKFGDISTFIFAKAFCIISMKSDFQTTCLARFLPHIFFETGRFDVYLDADQMPVIHISPIPAAYSEEEAVELIKSEGSIVKSYVQPGHNSDFYALNVLMKDNEEAYNVIDQLNYTLVDDTELVFTHFKKRDDIEAMKKWELRVSGLKPGITTSELNQFFSKYGRVFTITIVKQPFFAKVQFDEESSAMAAYDDFAKEDAELNVAYASQKSYLTIFVQNIPCFYSDEQIKNLFPTAISIQANKNKIDRSLPLSVVLKFASEKDGEEALQKGNSTYVRDLRLFCVPFIQKDRQALEKVGVKANPEATIFISNLKYYVKYEQIVELCANFGKLERVTLLKKKGRRDASAIVQFSDKKAAEQAIEEISEFDMDGWVPEAQQYEDKEVARAKAIAKSIREQKARRYQQHSQPTQNKEENKDDKDNDDDDDDDDQ